MLTGMDGVADLDKLLEAARALGADVVVDPATEPNDPRALLEVIGLVCGTADVQAMNAAMQAGRLGIVDPATEIGVATAEAAGLEDVGSATTWLIWHISQVADVAADLADELQERHLAAVAALVTAAQATLSSVMHRRAGEPESTVQALRDEANRLLAVAEQYLNP